MQGIEARIIPKRCFLLYLARERSCKTTSEVSKNRYSADYRNWCSVYFLIFFYNLDFVWVYAVYWSVSEYYYVILIEVFVFVWGIFSVFFIVLLKFGNFILGIWAGDELFTGIYHFWQCFEGIWWFPFFVKKYIKVTSFTNLIHAFIHFMFLQWDFYW